MRIGNIKEFIDDTKLILPDQRVLIAVSGGVDSVVLAHVLHSLGYEISIAHCNYGLRGQDSNEDEILVRSLAASLSVPVFVKRFDKSELIDSKGKSVQMAARDARYQWFKHLLEEYQYDKVATAHHQEDHVETILLNLIRGSGPEGLLGIPLQREKVIRPLFNCIKSEIVDYAKDHQLKWREDGSNLESKYVRNRIRNEVIPLLQSINPALVDTLSRNSNYLKQIISLFELQMEEEEQLATIEVNGNIEINLAKLRIDSSTFLNWFLRKFGFNIHQIELVIENLNSTGTIYQSTDFQLNIDRKKLYLGPIEEGREYYEIGLDTRMIETKFLQLSIASYKVHGYNIDADSNTAALDLSSMQFPLILRSWQEGDAFKPLGMKGKKKISDLMIDRKIPLNLKRRQLVLISGNDIAWVVGHQISEQFKVSKKTTEILEIKTLPQDVQSL